MEVFVYGVAERRLDRRIHREMAIVREGHAQLHQGLDPLVRAVMHGAQIGDREVAAAVRRVGAGRDGRGVGRPHRGGRPGCAEQAVGDPFLRTDAQRVEPRPVRAQMRHEEALGEAEPQIGAHLLHALQRRLARMRDRAVIVGRGDVAGAEARIIVARPDDAVEIDLAEAHRGDTSNASPRVSPSNSALTGSSVARSSSISTWPKQQA